MHNRFWSLRCGNGNGTERVGKRAQCSTGTQNAQAWQIPIVTISSKRVFRVRLSKGGRPGSDRTTR